MIQKNKYISLIGEISENHNLQINLFVCTNKLIKVYE